MTLIEGCNTLSLSCFNKLKKEILDGTYAPGEKLSTLKLKEDLNMGQSPIREALSRLLDTGLVLLEENKGFRVADVSEKDLRDLCDVVIQIEKIAIRQSLEWGNDQWEVDLVASLHRLAINETKKEPVNYLSWAECKFSFYRCIILGCNSPYLIQIHDILFLKLERYLKFAIKLDTNVPQKCHQREKRLFESALKRDADESCRLFVECLLRKLEYIKHALKNKP